ncbi:MAG: PorT family protein [Dysgonamonadaceae bacterium]|nr:PorT family protein [Dysgonamonadaceae bacterium]
MKKILFVGILFFFFASTVFAQVNIGVTAGLNFSDNLHKHADGVASSNNTKTGFRAGIVADYSINDRFSIIPELLFSQLGSKGQNSYLRLNYLQLPVNIAYKFNVGSNSKLFAFAGPYIGYGLSAKLRTEGGDYLDVKFGSKKDDYNPFDFGVNVGTGFQYKKVFIKCQFNPGLYNLSNEDNLSFKNINLAVSVGYYFK